MSQVNDAVDAARRAGHTMAAADAWKRVLANTHVDEQEYGDWCRELGNVLLHNGRGLSAARIQEYLGATETARRLYHEHGSARDEARVCFMSGDAKTAATLFRDAGLFAHAAQAAEAAGAHAEAIALYEQLGRGQEARGSHLHEGLAALNAGRVATEKGDPARAKSHFARAIRRLEEQADVDEQRGRRDDAFKWYQCILQIGVLESSYEHIAEGGLNCIRLLKEKADRFHTMQAYYDLISRSEEMKELHSAAELYREAGEYARRVGFIYANHFLAEAGEAWKRVATAGMEAQNPAELIENALLAAIGCFNATGNVQSVVGCYRALAALELGDKATARYTQLADELTTEDLKDEKPIAFPAYFQRRLTPKPVWLDALLKAETGPDVSEAIGRLVGDTKQVWEVQRRRALLIALEYDAHVAGSPGSTALPGTLVDQICQLSHPAILAPLEAQFDSGDVAARCRVLRGAAKVRGHPGIIELVEKGLRDEDASVRKEATQSLGQLAFVQALDGLVRLYNTFDDGLVQETCMRTVARIGTDEAAEFLLDVLRRDRSERSALARRLLERHAEERMLSALERNKRSEPDPALRGFITRLVTRIREERRLRYQA